MGGKARANAASKPFSKARGAATPSPDAPAAVVSEEPIDEAAAEAKLKAALAKSSAASTSTADETGDYVFATPGLDPRMAGRVSSWIQEIEAKDRYTRRSCTSGCRTGRGDRQRSKSQLRTN